MKVVYLYSNLPSYRGDFFCELSKSLELDNNSLIVLHGIYEGGKVVKQVEGDVNYEKYSFPVNKRKFVLPMEIMEGCFNRFKEINPDALVISYQSANVSMLRIVLYCLIKGIPYATWRCGYNGYDNHSSFFSKIREKMIKFVEKHAKYNIAYGSYYKGILEKKGISPSNIIIAQNTINIEKIIEENRDYGVKVFDENIIRILFVGAIVKKKYIETSILAVKKLIETGYKVSFDIVGGGEPLDDLKKLVEKENLGDYVQFAGPQYGENLKYYWRNSHVFLAAGIGGLAINEAMAYGLPIISTNADGTICDLIDGNGFFMDKFGDVELQYECLERFIKTTKEEKMQMSQCSLEIIKTKASQKNMVEKHKFVCDCLRNKN